MQIRNNYDIEWEKNGIEGTGIFNGDIGTILDIDPSGESVRIDFDGRIAYYDFMMKKGFFDDKSFVKVKK